MVGMCINSTVNISFGTYQIPVNLTRSTIEGALKAEYRGIDCAPVYFNEHIIGDVLSEHFSKNILQRKDIFIKSKLPSPFHRKEYVEKALRKTLSDLRTDYLDLYLVHWPVAFYPVEDALDTSRRGYLDESIDDSNEGRNIDPKVSVHETWEAMEDLVEKGLVRQIGVSNFPVSLLHELMSKCRIPPIVNQVEMHPYLQQTKLLTYCKKRGIQVEAYSPLGTPGNKEKDDPMVMDDPVLRAIAKKRNVTVAQVCLAWALQRGTFVVVKSVSFDRQVENLMVQQDGFLTLDGEELAMIAELDRGYRFFRPEDWWGYMGMAVFA
eukprot:CAMPEP_0172437610 /NCGR_PEP_ID=MMETSP1064-20121228/72342_1 /TAXON_ID=202472 /ORGANISM="Aulacoseira subarctica , Strain CCAP 1002/5" /LENGTH=321 /DNA_ID=CAMNT_0013186101 /DNA_START=60 /DNA_END=1025 /DNA_ORIENTATION=-